MASTHKSLRSSTANKRPTTSIADGQIALNTNSTSPGLFFKDSTGATIIKVGPVHVGTTAPNATPAAGGSSGNSTGEVWLDTSLTPAGVKIWNGGSWTNATPIGSTTVQGLLELATDVETQAGADTARAVTPAGLQSKVSDSTSTTSSTTIASSTAVKSAYNLANAALPKSGGTVTGNLEIGTTGSLTFEGSTADGFETAFAVTDPTADRTITFPDATGNAVVDTAGQTVQFGLGAAATPSVTFTGDTNTGIYSPGADQVAISTNGTGRLFVDASGNVGVGAAPTTRLEVARQGAAWTGVAPVPGTALFVHSGSASTTSPARLSILSGNATDASINFGDTDNNGEAVIKLDNTNDSLQFAVNGSERLRITSAGLVGIGTSAPGALLSLAGSSAYTVGNSGRATQGLDINATAGGSGLFGGALSFGVGGTGRASISAVQGTTDNDVVGLTFNIHNSGTAAADAVEAMRIDGSSGRVGIGDTAPDSTLTIKAAASTTPLRVSGPSSEFARIDASGRLLVGTSTAFPVRIATTAITPQQQLAGNSGTASTFVQGCASTVDSTAAFHWFAKFASGTINDNTVSVNNNETLGQITWSGSDGTNQTQAAQVTAFVDGTPGANNMPGRIVLSTTASGASSPTERMRIDSSGRVGIGSTSPNSVLQVNSGANLGGILVGFNSGSSNFYDADLQVFRTGNGTERMRITSGGERLLNCTGLSGDAPNNQGSRYFQTNGNEKVRGGSTSGSNADTVFQFYHGTKTSADGSITVSTTATAYNTTSDYRRKENEVAITDGIKRLTRLKPYRFNFIGLPSHVVDGFFAHEVQEVVPEAITGEKDAVDADGNPIYQGIDQSKLVPLLTAALQEAIGQIEALKARVTALEGA